LAICDKNCCVGVKEVLGKMIIVYESKTGFTKKYADMLAEKTKLKAYRVKNFRSLLKTKK